MYSAVLYTIQCSVGGTMKDQLESTSGLVRGTHVPPKTPQATHPPCVPTDMVHKLHWGSPITFVQPHTFNSRKFNHEFGQQVPFTCIAL